MTVDKQKVEIKRCLWRFRFKRWWNSNGWWLCYVFTVLFLLIGAAASVR